MGLGIGRYSILNDLDQDQGQKKKLMGTSLISSCELGGADGLLDSFSTCIQSTRVETWRGCKLWQEYLVLEAPQNYLGRDVLSVYSVCNQSDFAFESIQSQVSELSKSMTNVLAG